MGYWCWPQPFGSILLRRGIRLGLGEPPTHNSLFQSNIMTALTFVDLTMIARHSSATSIKIFDKIKFYYLQELAVT